MGRGARISSAWVVKMHGLTQRQREVLAFLLECQDRQGFCPSREEIRRHFGFRSPNAVASHLRALAKKGCVQWRPNRARAIRILKRQPGHHASSTHGRIPLLGRIAAGLPIFAEQNIEDSLSVPAGFLGNGVHSAVHVRGDSMRDAGIDDGDIALLRHEQAPAVGEIMAVVIDDEATLKRVFPSPRRLVLHSENPAYTDMVIHPDGGDSIRIAGRLVGVLKQWR